MKSTIKKNQQTSQSLSCNSQSSCKLREAIKRKRCSSCTECLPCNKKQCTSNITCTKDIKSNNVDHVENPAVPSGSIASMAAKSVPDRAVYSDLVKKASMHKLSVSLVQLDFSNHADFPEGKPININVQSTHNLNNPIENPSNSAISPSCSHNINSEADKKTKCLASDKCSKRTKSLLRSSSDGARNKASHAPAPTLGNDYIDKRINASKSCQKTNQSSSLVAINRRPNLKTSKHSFKNWVSPRHRRSLTSNITGLKKSQTSEKKGPSVSKFPSNSDKSLPSLSKLRDISNKRKRVTSTVTVTNCGDPNTGTIACPVVPCGDSGSGTTAQSRPHAAPGPGTVFKKSLSDESKPAENVNLNSAVKFPCEKRGKNVNTHNELPCDSTNCQEVVVSLEKIMVPLDMRCSFVETESAPEIETCKRPRKKIRLTRKVPLDTEDRAGASPGINPQTSLPETLNLPKKKLICHAPSLLSPKLPLEITEKESKIEMKSVKVCCPEARNFAVTPAMRSKRCNSASKNRNHANLTSEKIALRKRGSSLPNKELKCNSSDLVSVHDSVEGFEGFEMSHVEPFPDDPSAAEEILLEMFSDEPPLKSSDVNPKVNNSSTKELPDTSSDVNPKVNNSSTKELPDASSDVNPKVNNSSTKELPDASIDVSTQAVNPSRNRCSFKGFAPSATRKSARTQTCGKRSVEEDQFTAKDNKSPKLELNLNVNNIIDQEEEKSTAAAARLITPCLRQMNENFAGDNVAPTKPLPRISRNCNFFRPINGGKSNPIHRKDMQGTNEPMARNEYHTRSSGTKTKEFSEIVVSDPVVNKSVHAPQFQLDHPWPDCGNNMEDLLLEAEDKCDVESPHPAGSPAYPKTSNLQVQTGPHLKSVINIHARLQTPSRKIIASQMMKRSNLASRVINSRNIPSQFLSNRNIASQSMVNSVENKTRLFCDSLVGKENRVEPSGEAPARGLEGLLPARKKAPVMCLSITEVKRTKNPNVTELKHTKNPNVTELKRTKNPNVTEMKRTKNPNVTELKRTKTPSTTKLKPLNKSLGVAELKRAKNQDVTKLIHTKSLGAELRRKKNLGAAELKRKSLGAVELKRKSLGAAELKRKSLGAAELN
ncbi:uncharacterized protein LOC125179017 [Hyalella azteca]|uniref:Uncharacterized protein LOC125179017 n=1 Tax=Hyalella azteca TaxID=294128 RepID=A0A979FS84_HYAAZ|nr:uncharacterized protein LOC125179017 [Hyalella azteca]